VGKIPTLIVSKNRACQLRLLLESLQFNATGIFQPYVLWTADTIDFEKGYNQLISENMGAFFVRETYLLSNFYNFLNQFREGHFALFMDDCIFYRPLRITAEELTSKLDHETWAVNLRVGNNNVSENEKPLDPVSEDGGFLKYNFKEHSAFDSYGFCFSWDGVIYKTHAVMDFFDGSDFTETDNLWAILPQRIENFATNNRDKCPKDLVCCPNKSCVVSMNYNSTHPSAEFDAAPLDQLNYGYLSGAVIDFSSINFDRIASTHEEREFSLRRIA